MKRVHRPLEVADRAEHLASPQPDEHAQPPDQRDLLTQLEVLTRLGISRETFRRWRAFGLVPPPVRLPGHPRWSRKVIEAFMAELESGEGRPRFFRKARRHGFALVVNRAAPTATGDAGSGVAASGDDASTASTHPSRRG